MDLVQPAAAENKSTMVVSHTIECFPWEKLPYELREQIFNLVRDEHSKIWPEYYSLKAWRTVPPLVLALRPLELSYCHVLKHFARANSWLSMRDPLDFDLRSLNKRELATIVRLELDLT